MRKLYLLSTLLLSLVFQTNAQFDKIAKGISLPGGMNDSKVASGLKQALEIGTTNTVTQTGATNGYFGNQAIKILLPEKLRSLEKGLRLAGQGAQVDEFELSMNRAAEKAAPAASNIFKSAIAGMTFEDARAILKGDKTAATEYFKKKTSDQLTTAFRPIVESTMNETGVNQKYKMLSGQLPSLPFGHTSLFDINSYVVSKSLDGLFYVLGQEEQKIRTNPAAQVTPLLKQVFGGG
jgi:Protein of unknown function (DUF4197)